MGEVVTPRVCDPRSEEALDALVHQASASAGWTERNARYLLDKVDEIVRARTWPQRLDGQPQTWQRFCAEVLGYDAAYIEHIRRGVCILQARGVHSPTVGDALSAVQVDAALEEATQRADGAPKGNMNAAKARDKTTFDNVQGCLRARAPTGNSRARALRRLRQQRPELHARVLAGEMSAHGAAIAAGFCLPTITLPLDPQRAASLLCKHFEAGQRDELIALLLSARAIEDQDGNGQGGDGGPD